MTVDDVENMLDHMPRAARDYDQHAAMHTDSYNFSGLTSDSVSDDADDYSAESAEAEESEESEESDDSRTGASAPDQAASRSASE